MPKRWTIRYQHNRWRVYDRGTWSDTFDTLPEAHTYATQCAICDELFTDGALTRLKLLMERGADAAK